MHYIMSKDGRTIESDRFAEARRSAARLTRALLARTGHAGPPHTIVGVIQLFLRRRHTCGFESPSRAIA